MSMILIVDDSQDVRGAIRDFVRHWRPSVQVLEAQNGHEGVKLAEKYHPDLILMDMSMPRVDGATATSTLKSQDDTGEIPVIGMTADAHFNVYLTMKAEPICQAFLYKPFNVTDLFDTIGPLLSAPH